MKIVQYHQGGVNPAVHSQNGQNPQGLPTCDRKTDPAFHNTFPYKHIIRKFNQDDFGGGCICTDKIDLEIDGIITIGVIPAGTTLKDLQWDVIKTDSTFQVDIEVIKASVVVAAGVSGSVVPAGAVVKAGLGEAIEDGAASPNTYFSKYAVPCTGKDCYGVAETKGGLDHGLIVLRVKALPTGVGSGCNADKAAFGTLQANFSYVVTDLR